MPSIPPPPPEEQVFGRGAIPPPPPEEAIFGGTAPAAPAQNEVNPTSMLFGDKMGSPLTPAGQLMSALEGIARANRKGVKGWKMAGDIAGPDVGNAAETAAKFILPTSKLGVATTAISSFLPSKNIAEAAKPVASAAKSVTSKVGAGAAEIAASVPQKHAEAVFKDPSILNRAMDQETMGKAYDTFERYSGLKNLEQTLVSEGRATASPARLEKMVIGTANRVKAGEKVDPQDLYLASQAASRLKLMSKFGEPQAAMAASSGALAQGKQIVDEAFEKVFPEARSLRIGNFESKAREAFSHLLPQNKNMTPNKLRGFAALVTALAGHPAALPLVSPAAWGLGIRAGALAGPPVLKAADVAARMGAKTLADQLQSMEPR